MNAQAKFQIKFPNLKANARITEESSGEIIAHLSATERDEFEFEENEELTNLELFEKVNEFELNSLFAEALENAREEFSDRFPHLNPEEFSDTHTEKEMCDACEMEHIKFGEELTNLEYFASLELA